jgi:hypothetical protein
MSALGQKRTCQAACAMSAFDPESCRDCRRSPCLLWATSGLVRRSKQHSVMCAVRFRGVDVSPAQLHSGSVSSVVRPIQFL